MKAHPHPDVAELERYNLDAFKASRCTCNHRGAKHLMMAGNPGLLCWDYLWCNRKGFVERPEASLRGNVPVLLRHWRLRHELTVNPRAPLAVKALIAKAARELAGDAGPATETGMVRR